MIFVRLITSAIATAVLTLLAIVGAVLLWLGLIALTLLLMVATAVVYGLAWPIAQARKPKPSAVVLPFDGKRRAPR